MVRSWAVRMYLRRCLNDTPDSAFRGGGGRLPWSGGVEESVMVVFQLALQVSPQRCDPEQAFGHLLGSLGRGVGVGTHRLLTALPPYGCSFRES